MLNVVLPVKVKLDVSRDVYNQASQHTFGKEVKIETVVNHIPKITPTKDGVIKVGDKQSLNNKQVDYGTVFNYSLSSSIRPVNAGVDTEEWSMMDILSDKDQATGQFSVLVARSFVLPDGNKVAAGTDISRYFEYKVMKNSENKTVVSIQAKKEFLAAINLPENKATEQGWTAFVQVKRVGYCDEENTFTESYNHEVQYSGDTHAKRARTNNINERSTNTIRNSTIVCRKSITYPRIITNRGKKNHVISMIGAGMFAMGSWFGLRKRKENE